MQTPHPRVRRSWLILLALVFLAVFLASRPASDSSPGAEHPLTRAASPEFDFEPPTRSVATPKSNHPSRSRLPPLAASAKLRAESAGVVLIDAAIPPSSRTVRGFVFDAEGAPVPGANVTLADQNLIRAWSTTSDASGSFAFLGAPPSELRLQAAVSGEGRDVEWVDGCDCDVARDLVLEPIASVRVVAPSARQGDFELHCASDDCFGHRAPWQTPAEYEDELKDVLLYRHRHAVPYRPLSPGREVVPIGNVPPSWTIVAEAPLGTTVEVAADLDYEIVIDASGDESGCGSIRPGPGEDLEVRCGVPSVATFTGRLLDAVGQPVSDPLFAISIARATEAPCRITAIDPDGRFEASIPLTHPEAIQIWSDRWAPDRETFYVYPNQVTAAGDIVVRGHCIGECFRRAEAAYFANPFGTIGAVANHGFVAVLQPDGPLARAGLSEGDTIVRIDGVSTAQFRQTSWEDPIWKRAEYETVMLSVRTGDGDYFETAFTLVGTTPLPFVGPFDDLPELPLPELP